MIQLIESKAGNISNQAAATILWAFSVGHRKESRELFEKLAPHIEFSSLSPELFSAVLLGFAKEEVAVPDFAVCWDSLPHRELVNVVWALARLADTERLASSCGTLSSKYRECSSEEIYSLARSIALVYYNL